MVKFEVIIRAERALSLAFKVAIGRRERSLTLEVAVG